MTNLENYLNNCGNELVSEKSLKYFLPLIYPEIIKEISIKKLCIYYNIELDDENIKSKRFDFVSINSKLIIEFDGQQHFNHIEHFGSYKQFIKLQSSDFLKHKFIKQYNFNLIRITGKLTLNEFYNLIKNIDFNTSNPKVIFIENNMMNCIELNQLNDLPNDIDLLQTKLLDSENKLKNKNEYISNLENQIVNLQNQLNILNEPKSNKKIKEDSVYYFLLWAEEKGFLIGQPPTIGLYPIYVNWNKKENPNTKPLNAKEFTVRLKKLANKFNFEYVNERITISKISKLNFNTEVLNKYFFNNKLNINKLSQSRYNICNEQISDNDIANLKIKLVANELNFDNLSYKDLLIIYQLTHNNDQSAINFIKLLDESLKM